MFQTYDSTNEANASAPRVAQLRSLFDTLAIDGILVPRVDEHQGEYVAARSERLAWLTGFTGSWGQALILQKSAHVFVDGRYTVQAAQQLDAAVFKVEDLVATPPAKWIPEHLRPGARLGFDPWLHTISEVNALEAAMTKLGGSLVALDANPIDHIWIDQPQLPLAEITIQPLEFAGKTAREKLAAVQETLVSAKADATVLTDPSSLAWTFNIRGNDVPHTPVPLGFVIIRAEGEPVVFLDERKLPIKTRAYLTQLCEISAPENLPAALIEIAAGKSIALDPALAAEKLRRLVKDAGGTVIEVQDPCRLPRARKNPVELVGARAAHRRDGSAVSVFLTWYDAQTPGSLDEIGAAVKLEECRVTAGEVNQMPLLDVSFPSISSTGPNGAINHYRVTTTSNRTLQPGELFLLDSGGQYRDGTTDITRTLPVGNVSAEYKRRFTLVLKGMIAISMLRFPKGTKGSEIDAFARAALWGAGMDYAHGTGHGVGSYLSVHEGPQRIAKVGVTPLEPGMILSNEPGYYKPGEYGIRIENLIIVTEPEDIDGGDSAMMGFETLTLAPIDKRLIDTSLLTRAELHWIDTYHA
ncbi:MAG: aminopeptidase P family protein, partial [Rhizobiaceae bacterium]